MKLLNLQQDIQLVWVRLVKVWKFIIINIFTGTSQFRQYQGGFLASGEIFFIGIIDCLTYYGAAKKIAHSFKSLLWNKEQLSTVQ